jgi:hypothetical protein
MLVGRFRIQDAGCRMQDAGCRMQDAGCRMQDAGCRIVLVLTFVQEHNVW